MATKTTDHDPFDMVASALMHLVWYSLIGLGVAGWWAVLFPMISIPLGLAVAAGLFLGWVWGVVVVGVSIAGMVLWRRRSRQTFEQWITSRARTRFLAWFRYRRRWAKLLQACNLTIDRDDATFVPRLVGVQVGDAMDRLQVRMLAGQCPDDYENRTAHLAHAFGALECRATIIGPAMVELAFRHADSLAETIELPRIDGGRWTKDAA
jgi:hypothetical protein